MDQKSRIFGDKKSDDFSFLYENGDNPTRSGGIVVDNIEEITDNNDIENNEPEVIQQETLPEADKLEDNLAEEIKQSNDNEVESFFESDSKETDNKNISNDLSENAPVYEDLSSPLENDILSEHIEKDNTTKENSDFNLEAEIKESPTAEDNSLFEIDENIKENVVSEESNQQQNKTEVETKNTNEEQKNVEVVNKDEDWLNEDNELSNDVEKVHDEIEKPVIDDNTQQKDESKTQENTETIEVQPKKEEVVEVKNDNNKQEQKVSDDEDEEEYEDDKENINSAADNFSFNDEDIAYLETINDDFAPEIEAERIKVEQAEKKRIGEVEEENQDMELEPLRNDDKLEDIAELNTNNIEEFLKKNGKVFCQLNQNNNTENKAVDGEVKSEQQIMTNICDTALNSVKLDDSLWNELNLSDEMKEKIAKKVKIEMKKFYDDDLLPILEKKNK